MDDNWGPYVAIVLAVTLGLVALLVGQTAGPSILVYAGGAVSLLAVGLLTLFVHRSG